MMRRQIGDTPYQTGKLALGCVTFGREIDEPSSFRIMDYAADHGIALFDTAEVYGAGASESIIGKWMRARGSRASIVLQSKTLAHTPDDIERAVVSSLERLQTEKIDLYLLHRLNPGTPLRETLEALQSAMRSGRIGAIGCSNCTAIQLRQALEVSRRYGLPRFAVQQPVYNLAAREIEAEFLQLCRIENIAAISYSPLGAGFLSGKYRERVPTGSRFDIVPGHVDVYFSDANFALVRRLAEFSERTGAPMVKLAMAWTLHNPDLTAVLVGARTPAHLSNAIDALEWELPEEWFAEMDVFSRPASF